jgi:hypothetical protein
MNKDKTNNSCIRRKLKQTILSSLQTNKENMKIFRKYVDIKVPLSILPQYKNRRD